MSARKIRIPSYRLHKGSGQAVVVIHGRSIYLGKWNTPKSKAEYERVLAEWLTCGRQVRGNCIRGVSNNNKSQEQVFHGPRAGWFADPPLIHFSDDEFQHLACSGQSHLWVRISDVDRLLNPYSRFLELVR